jgi:uncharacterized damage-inducible protein DinB
MDQKELYLKFWENEGPATRKVISRIPQDKSDYKPDPKARNARELAWVIVTEEQGLVECLTNGKIEWKDVPPPNNVKDILDAYDSSHDGLTKKLKELDAPAWEKEVVLLFQGQEVMRAPGYEMAWGFLLDQIHHRGQLSTYLRPMGSTVPAIYGPSADEQS